MKNLISHLFKKKTEKSFRKVRITVLSTQIWPEYYCSPDHQAVLCMNKKNCIFKRLFNYSQFLCEFLNPEISWQAFFIRVKSKQKIIINEGMENTNCQHISLFIRLFVCRIFFLLRTNARSQLCHQVESFSKCHSFCIQQTAYDYINDNVL